MLLDLARTTLFLHDASVKSLDELLDPKRGKKSPHPFYIIDEKERADMIEFLKGLDIDRKASRKKRGKKLMIYTMLSDRLYT